MTWLFLQNAPGEISSELRSKISHDNEVKTRLERMRDCGGSASEVRQLAKNIYLPPILKPFK